MTTSRIFYIESNFVDDPFPENLIRVEERADGFWIHEFQSRLNKSEGDENRWACFYGTNNRLDDRIRQRHVCGWILRRIQDVSRFEPSLQLRDMINVLETIVQMEQHPITRMYHELWLKRILLFKESGAAYDYIHDHYHTIWQDDPDFLERRNMVVLAHAAGRGSLGNIPPELLRTLKGFLTPLS